MFLPDVDVVAALDWPCAIWPVTVAVDCALPAPMEAILKSGTPVTGPVSPLSDGSLPSLLHETAVPEAVRRVDPPPHRVPRTRAGDTLTVHSPRGMPTSVHAWGRPRSARGDLRLKEGAGS